MACLQPYKGIGLLTTQPYLFLRRNRAPAMLTLAGCSFRMWSVPALSVMLIGPRFDQPVRLATATGEEVHLVVGQTLLCLKFHHLLYRLPLPLPPDGPIHGL
jgi:hypothetical protein